MENMLDDARWFFLVVVILLVALGVIIGWVLL